jgi:hypothetical protein
MATTDHYRGLALPVAMGAALALLVGCNDRAAADADDAGDMPPLIEREVEDAPESQPEATAAAGTQAPAAVVIAPMPPPPSDTDTTEIPVDVIVMTPAPHLGQAVAGTAKVAEVPFDRGFWIEKNGQRMFAMIAKSPNMEQAINVNPGQTVRLSGVVYDNSLAAGIRGEIEPQAMETIAKQPAFLLVDARNITVVDAPAR